MYLGYTWHPVLCVLRRTWHPVLCVEATHEVHLASRSTCGLEATFAPRG